MKKHTILLVAVALLAFGAAHAKEGGILPFGEDHDRGLEDARRTGRPVLVYFTAGW
jgi:hypothetical protein